MLDKTIYTLSVDRGAIGPKEHSFFITFLLHGINLWTILSLLFMKYFNINLPVYIGLSISVFVFAVGYFAYIRSGRANKIIMNDVSRLKALLSIVISLAYMSISIYSMIKVGDFIRLANIS